MRVGPLEGHDLSNGSDNLQIKALFKLRPFLHNSYNSYTKKNVFSQIIGDEFHQDTIHVDTVHHSECPTSVLSNYSYMKPA